MKQFIENQFEITKKDEDRITKDEFHELYSAHTKCNYAWTSILSDIKRLGLCYDGGKRSIYKGITIRGVLVGIKKKVLDPFVETSDLDVQDAKDAEIKALKKEIEDLKKQMKLSSLDAGIVEEVEPQPIEIIITPEQYIIKELKKQQEWIIELQNEMKQRKKKKKKQDPARFELFLNDLEDLCN
jgi:hypothetical protein